MDAGSCVDGTNGSWDRSKREGDRWEVCGHALSAEYPPETGWGGIGTYVYAIGHTLADRGHTVHVISLSLDEHDHYWVDNGVHVHRLATQRWPLPPRLQRFGPDVRATLERSLTVARYLARLRHTIIFDVVEASNFGGEALLYSLWPLAPLIMNISTPLATVASVTGLMENPRPGLRLRRWMEGVPVRRAALIIANSQFTAAFTQREYAVPAARIHVVLRGLDYSGIKARLAVCRRERSNGVRDRGPAGGVGCPAGDRV